MWCVYCTAYGVEWNSITFVFVYFSVRPITIKPAELSIRRAEKKQNIEYNVNKEIVILQTTENWAVFRKLLQFSVYTHRHRTQSHFRHCSKFLNFCLKRVSSLGAIVVIFFLLFFHFILRTQAIWFMCELVK